jgi:Protein of unknown function (DUF3489)
MSIKLTDTQLVMLSAAAQREDRCIEAPPSLKGAAAQKIATKLVAAGLVKEMKAKPGAHIWRRDDENSQAFVLKLTAAGLKAIAVEDAEAAGPAVEISPPATGEVPTNIVDHEAPAENVAGSTTIAMPREGSKLAAVVDLLRREDGATVEELAGAMGWEPLWRPTILARCPLPDVEEPNLPGRDRAQRQSVSGRTCSDRR